MEENQKSKLPVSQKLSWGIGGITENLSTNVVPTLSYNIFQVGMGISPLVIGIATAASRLIEAFTDPLIGHLSDNTRSKWGRRRPWIFMGAIIMSLIFASIWLTPRSVSDWTIFGQTINGSVLQGAYFVVAVSLFFMTFTIWQIPFGGMGLELEVDYIQRTKLQTYKIVFSYIIGAVIGSLYIITQLKIWNGDEVTGARYVGLIIAGALLITGLIPAFLCKERYEIKHEKVKFWPSFKETLKDKPFIFLIGALFFVFLSLYFMLPLLSYISLYHVSYDGLHKVLIWGGWRHPFTFSIVEKIVTHKELAGYIGGYTGVVQTLATLSTVPVVNYFSKKYDKKIIMIAGLIIGILGYFTSWFLFTPQYPYLTIAPPVLVNIGLSACWILIGSFCADICDYDELITGKRREGMFSAVMGFLIKASIAAVSVITSGVLIYLGIEGKDPKLTVDQLTTIRLVYVVVPALAMFGAILFMAKYPLNRARVKEIQDELNLKRTEVVLK